MHVVLLPFLWVLNGFLATLYVVVGHAPGVLAALAAGAVTVTAPHEQRRYAIVAALLLGSASLVSPSLLAVMAALMAGMGAVAVRLERFNPFALSWRVVGGLGLYGMLLWGFTLYRAVGGFPDASLGISYLDAIVHIAVYAYPLGFLAVLAQALWVHPPLPASPDDIITTVRTRGRSE